MYNDCTFSEKKLARLFPFHIIADKHFIVQKATEGISKIAGEIIEQNVNEIFALESADIGKIDQEYIDSVDGVHFFVRSLSDSALMLECEVFQKGTTFIVKLPKINEYE